MKNNRETLKKIAIKGILMVVYGKGLQEIGDNLDDTVTELYNLLDDIDYQIDEVERNMGEKNA